MLWPLWSRVHIPHSKSCCRLCPVHFFEHSPFRVAKTWQGCHGTLASVPCPCPHDLQSCGAREVALGWSWISFCEVVLSLECQIALWSRPRILHCIIVLSPGSFAPLEMGHLIDCVHSAGFAYWFISSWHIFFHSSMESSPALCQSREYRHVEVCLPHA